MLHAGRRRALFVLIVGHTPLCLFKANNSEVSIKWMDPPEINGAILHYHLKFNDVTKREHLPICISYDDFMKSSGYQLKVRLRNSNEGVTPATFSQFEQLKKYLFLTLIRRTCRQEIIVCRSGPPPLLGKASGRIQSFTSSKILSKISNSSTCYSSLLHVSRRIVHFLP